MDGGAHRVEDEVAGEAPAHEDLAVGEVDELQHALEDIRCLIREIKQGQGVLGTLISNRDAADNLRTLIANLKRYGILWYRDGEKAKSPAPTR